MSREKLWWVLTIFKAEMAAKYGAPVYSRQPPITAIFPDTDQFTTTQEELNIRNHGQKIEFYSLSPITQLEYGVSNRNEKGGKHKGGEL